MRTYRVRLQEFGISDLRMKELESFCMQYPEKKVRLKNLLFAVLSVRLNGMPGGTQPGSPTESAAMRIISENLTRDIEDIEAAAAEASDGLGDVIRKSLLNYVTQRKKPPIDWIPCGRRQFYAIRRRFFIALDRRRGGQSMGVG